MGQIFASVLAGLLQISLFALIAPALLGGKRWIKARLQRRPGPLPWQVYLDLFKLLRIHVKKQPEPTSWVFAIAPFTAFMCYALLAWAAPPFLYSGITLDIVTVVFLLGLARFILALAGMDTGTPFGGMGSSREMFINVLAEPLLVLIILTLTLQHQTTSTGLIITSFPYFSPDTFVFSFAALLFLWPALAFIAVMDNGLLPVDNPSTLLELTMIQKGLHLEYSGRNLALIEWGEAMRLTFFLTLLGDLLIPRSISDFSDLPLSILGLPVYVVKLLLGIGLLALYQITQIKLRLRWVVKPWITMLFLSAAATSLAVISIIQLPSGGK